MSNWLLCVEIMLENAHPDREEAIEAALWELEVAGVERQDDTTFSMLVDEPRPRPRGAVRWRIYMPDAEDEAAAPFRDAVGELAQVTSWRLEDLTFLTAWKEFFRPTRVSPRIMVHPPWDVPTETGLALVEIEPGMAFGTGTHETTRLCLAAIDRTMTGACGSVLDVGCGSGVLAIAAAKLGAARVVACDIDPDAVAIAAENARLNHVAEIEVIAAEVDEVEGRFELVVANILPHTLIEMSRSLIPKVAPGGTLVLSGIVVELAPSVRTHFEAEGLGFVHTEQLGEWTALTFTLPRE